ncbi:hypothetical protein NFI96_012691, partial [Prochilodus magdalenae]
KKSASPVDGASSSTCFIPRGKRKTFSSELPQGKKRRREEVEENEEEEQQALRSATDREERCWNFCEFSHSVSSEDVSSEEQSNGTDSVPENSQSDSRDSEDTNIDILLRDVLDVKYIQGDCLGEGGYGSVYAGYRREDLLPVAIKHIPRDKIKYVIMVSDVDGARQQLPLEVALLKRAGEGEAVTGGTPGAPVALLDWYMLPDELVMVMERPVPCMDLTDYIEFKGGSLPEEEAKEILRQLVESMISIHSKGILHRDIKPGNILVQTNPEGPRVRVLDFGCGTLLKEGPYTQYSGTTLYTPPEWYLQRSYLAEPCTVWQIGVVLYVMLCGELPFVTSAEIVGEDFYLPVHLSEDSQDLLGGCLDKCSQARPSLYDILEHPWLQ